METNMMTSDTGNTMSRRKALMIATAVPILALPLAACPSTSVGTFVAQIAALLNAVQQGVRNGLEKICTVANSLVPTADSVLAFIEATINATVGASNIAALLTQAQQFVDAIVALGCPTPMPTPTPMPAGVVVRAGLDAKVNGTALTIKFY
jgi:hypothetical protein